MDKIEYKYYYILGNFVTVDFLRENLDLLKYKWRYIPVNSIQDMDKFTSSGITDNDYKMSLSFDDLFNSKDKLFLEVSVNKCVSNFEAYTLSSLLHRQSVTQQKLALNKINIANYKNCVENTKKDLDTNITCSSTKRDQLLNCYYEAKVKYNNSIIEQKQNKLDFKKANQEVRDFCAAHKNVYDVALYLMHHIKKEVS